MNTMRKTLTMAAVVASLGLLAACSKSEEPAVSPAAPAPSTTPTPAPVPPAAQDQSAAPQADQQSMQDKLSESAAAAKDKAAEVGQAVSDQAGKLADEAGKAADSARESVKEGAAKADAAIQGAVGNGK
ncbi:hypothetical protein [Castellaniella sp.]|uniref:hypothetical protein n=1 Tax=Castellaniella sp. TaxID=1955812 RepID=UPI002AFE3211|nr:hypothetical protein [Castellaniella sp.]